MTAFVIVLREDEDVVVTGPFASFNAAMENLKEVVIPSFVTDWLKDFGEEPDVEWWRDGAGMADEDISWTIQEMHAPKR